MLNSLKVLAGIAGSTLDWFSYLSGRILSVRTSKFASNPLTCGVPQGSVLGSLLFSFYMLPLAGIIPSLNAIFYHFYGEDIQLYMSFKPQADRLSALAHYFHPS